MKPEAIQVISGRLPKGSPELAVTGEPLEPALRRFLIGRRGSGPPSRERFGGTSPPSRQGFHLRQGSGGPVDATGSAVAPALRRDKS